MLDKYAQKIIAAIYLSLELFIKKTKNSPKDETWQNERCHKALLDIYCTQKYQALNFATGIVNFNAIEILKEAKKQLCKVVKIEKYKYYQKVIDKLDHTNIF